MVWIELCLFIVLKLDSIIWCLLSIHFDKIQVLNQRWSVYLFTQSTNRIQGFSVCFVACFGHLVQSINGYWSISLTTNDITDKIYIPSNFYIILSIIYAFDESAACTFARSWTSSTIVVRRASFWKLTFLKHFIYCYLCCSRRQLRSKCGQSISEKTNCCWEGCNTEVVILFFYFFPWVVIFYWLFLVSPTGS